MKTKFTFDLKTILIVGILLVVLFGGGFGILGTKLNNVNDKLSQQIALNNAIQDTLKYTKNKLDEQVATKLTLQATLDQVAKQNKHLSNNQKELLKRINQLKNKNDLISAALVRTEAKIDSLKNIGVVEINEKDTSITFKENNDSISFDLTVHKVMPVNTPQLNINSLIIPNEQFIQFNFEQENEYNQTPISFSISNSNPLIRTTGADSYIIPEVNPDIKPNFWDKFNEFMNKPAIKVIGGTIVFGGGVYVGATLF